MNSAASEGWCCGVELTDTPSLVAAFSLHPTWVCSESVSWYLLLFVFNEQNKKFRYLTAYSDLKVFVTANKKIPL